MEELFLCAFFAFEELHIVDEQQVDFTEAATEVAHLSGLNRADELVGELLGAHVGEAQRRGAAHEFVRDALHQVRLAQPRVAVNEERVVDLAGRLRGGLRGGGCDVV